MQFKTTAILAVVLLALLGWLLVERPDRQVDRETSTSPTSPATVAQKAVFDDPPESDDVVSVVIARDGQEPWRFVRTHGEDDDHQQAEWKMTAPVESAVPKWELNNLLRTVRELKYQIRYKPDDPDGIPLKQAGLDPPRFEITLEDDAGRSITLQVGKSAGTSETYVRADGKGDVLVAQRSLDHLIKKSANEYRDKTLVKFVATDAKSIEILHRPEDGEPISYHLAKHDGDWVFEEPFSADADDAAVNAAVASASRLRANEWVDVDPRFGYGRFGLTLPLLDVEIVTETVVKPDKPHEAPSSDSDSVTDDAEDDDAESEPPTRTETHRYNFQISAASPLGKDTAVYFKRNDDPAVATVIKSVADKLIPVIEKWRDMDVCPTVVTDADQITLRTATGPSTTLVKDDQAWTFQDTGARADGEAIDALLKTVDTLKAVNFVDRADPADPTFGLTDPAAEIVLTIPGRDQPERITVGRTTDPNSNRLYYVRRGESLSIAKVRAADVQKLQREPLEYLDRQIIGIAVSDLKRIDLTRPAAPRGDTPRPESLTLTHNDAGWRITEPVDAATETVAAVKLATTLADLTAERVVTRSGTPADYGLDNPAVSVTLTYETTTPAAPHADDDAEDAPQPPAPVDRTVVLHVAEKDRTLFAKRGDTPTIYQLRRADFDAILADVHDKTVLDFQQSQAVSVSITSGGVTHGFVKTDDGWAYASEPDLPIDPKKVTNLLLQLQDLKLKRYVAYGVPDLSVYGLDKPARIVRVKTDEGLAITLLVSARQSPADGGAVYAVIQGKSDVFILTPDNVARFDISLDDFEKAADS